MITIIIGGKTETRKWIQEKEQKSGKRIRYFGFGIGNGQSVLMFQSNKNDQPQARMVIRKREEKSEQL